MSRELYWINPDLQCQADIVANQPLLDNLVLAAEAIRNCSNCDGPTGWWAHHAETRVVAKTKQAMRREKTILIITGPDHIFRQQLAIRQRVERIERTHHYGFGASERVHSRMDLAVFSVQMVNQSDASSFPYLLRNLDDMIGKVRKIGIEALHARGPFSQSPRKGWPIPWRLSC